MFCMCLLLCSWAYSEESHLTTRSYLLPENASAFMNPVQLPVLTSTEDPALRFAPQAYRMQARPQLQEFLAAKGIPFPEGSWLKQDQGTGEVQMHSSEEGHRLLKEFLAMDFASPVDVSVQLQVLEVEERILDPIERQSPDPLQASDYLGLFAAGKAEQRSIQTLSGRGSSRLQLSFQEKEDNGQTSRTLQVLPDARSSEQRIHLWIFPEDPLLPKRKIARELILLPQQPSVLMSFTQTEEQIRYVWILRADLQLPTRSPPSP